MKTIALRVLLMYGTTASIVLGADAATMPPDLDFLLGQWHTTTPAEGSDSFQRDLGGHVIVRTAQSTTAAAKGGSMHSLMTIYAEQGAIRAIYLDDAGHVVHYTAASVSATAVQFVSDAAIGPHFRLTYSRTDSQHLAVRFEMAPPGSSGEFQTVAQATESKIN